MPFPALSGTEMKNLDNNKLGKKLRVPIYRAKDSSSDSSSVRARNRARIRNSSSDSSKVKLVKKDFYEFFVWR